MFVIVDSKNNFLSAIVTFFSDGPHLMFSESLGDALTFSESQAYQAIDQLHRHNRYGLHPVKTSGN